MHDGYWALLLCILTNMLPEQAFACIENGRKTISEADVAEMARLKQSMTYKEIGKIYGIAPNTVYRRIKKYQKEAAV